MSITPRLKPVIALLLGLNAVLASVSASAVVLDFEAAQTPGHALFPSGLNNPYIEDGFAISVLSSNSLVRWGTLNPRYLGSTMLFNNTLPGTTTLTEVGNNLFSITSITLARVTNTFLGNSQTFDGVKSDNSVVSVTFSLPFGDPATTIPTFLFPGTFTNLKSLSWSQAQGANTAVQFDDLVVSAVVPLPGALLLFGPALALLAGVTRRGRGTFGQARGTS